MMHNPYSNFIIYIQNKPSIKLFYMYCCFAIGQHHLSQPQPPRAGLKMDLHNKPCLRSGQVQ